MDTLYIVVPAYNEQETIRKFVGGWYPVIDKMSAASRLVIVDDGSRDNTQAILKELSRDLPKLTVLTRPNGGHGAAVLYGYRYAVSQGAEYVFQTDSDGQTDPREFDAFWERRKEYDAIFGNRTQRGDGRIRKMVENTVCLLLRMIFHVRVRDANAPFRLMRSEPLARYMKKLPPDYELPNIMLTTYFVYYHERVRFMDISFKNRQGGKNSVNIRRIVKIGMKALKDFRALKKQL